MQHITRKLRLHATAMLGLILAMFAYTSAWAQPARPAPPTTGAEAFNVATGDFKGGSTYAVMFRELGQECGTTVNLTEMASTGSVQNLDWLIDNVVDGAFVQGDIAEYERTVNPERVKNLRSLFELFPEELHFIARADTKTEGGVNLGFTTLGGTDVSYNKVEDLKGRTIGAVGGSVKTGQLFAKLSGLGFTVRAMDNNAALKAALLNKQLDAILVVAGAKSKFVAGDPTANPPVPGLDKNYRLLPVSMQMQADMFKLRPIYAPATITYDNLAAPTTVTTVATRALFLTKTYRSPAMLSKLAALRACFAQAVPTIQDRRGTHGKWQLVEPDAKPTWQPYDNLPSVR